MASAKALEAKAKAIADATPRPVVQALLKRFMPDRTVATRQPDPAFKLMGKREPLGMGEDGEVRVRQPAKFAALGRKRRTVARAQRYELTGKRDTSRYGTFRNYMLTTIILAHTEVTAARAAHTASGEHADQTINFAWAEKEGYIRFI